MQLVEEAQCQIPGLCSRLEDATLRRGWTDPLAVQNGTLTLIVDSANATSVAVRAVYNQEGSGPVDMPIFIVLEDERARLSCTQTLDGVARALTCLGPLAGSITLQFTAMAPNTVALAKPLIAAVTYTCKSAIRIQLEPVGLN
jgi:hypothetical protein